MTYPLGRSADRAAHERARLELQQNRAQIRRIELRIASEVTNAALRIESIRERIEAATASRELAEEQLQPARARHEGPAGRRSAAARPHSRREGRGPGRRGSHRVAMLLRARLRHPRAAALRSPIPCSRRDRADSSPLWTSPRHLSRSGDGTHGLERPISAISSLLIASQVDFVKLSASPPRSGSGDVRHGARRGAVGGPRAPAAGSIRVGSPARRRRHNHDSGHGGPESLVRSG